MAPTPLSAIPTLAELYSDNFLKPSSSPDSTATSRFTPKISLIRTDITTLKTDAIVNAANTSLLGGGGVDGAIHRAAGPELYDECSTLDGCDTGDAKITSAYELPCKKVIHAVGPVYSSAKRKGLHTSLLQSCYTRSLDLAVENDCRSIAFSALSTGVYGYPSREAAEGAIEAVKGWLEADEERAGKMDRIVFCQFLEKDQTAYEDIIPRYFTPETVEGGKEAVASTEGGSKTSVVDENADPASKLDAEKKDIATEDKPEVATEPVDDESKKTGTDAVPDLPDVPTKEPTQPGEPEVKKLKLSQ